MGIKFALLCLATVLVMGCQGRGLLYTSTIEPYTLNFSDSPVGSKSVITNTHQIKVPIGKGNLAGEWDAEVIMRAVREEGITNLHYIDIKKINILTVYSRQTLIVYGD